MGLEADQELAYEMRDAVMPNAARFLTAGKGIAATPIAGPPGEPRLGIPYGARTVQEGRQHVNELHARGVCEIKPFERVRVATDRARDIARIGVWRRHAMHDGDTS